MSGLFSQSWSENAQPGKPSLACFLFWEWRGNVVLCFLAYRGCSSGVARERGKISTPIAQNKSRISLPSALLCVPPLSHSEGKQCSSRKLRQLDCIPLYAVRPCLPPGLDWLSVSTVTHPPGLSPWFSLSCLQYMRLSLASVVSAPASHILTN